jgi:hypothetical protein
MKRLIILALTTTLHFFTTMTQANPLQAIQSELAPSGKIRASINVGTLRCVD